jgi:hypothetical protein
MEHQKTNQLNLRLDYRVIALLLVAVIAAMLFVWKPWQDTISANSRTIEVTGESKLTATPDEFMFYPSYQFKNNDKQAALSELTAKSNEVVAKLKELGVAEKKIKTDASGYDFPIHTEGSAPTYTLTLTVTINDSELAQKVQDYLVTTTPSGSVSPQANFSDEKRKELENRARDKATKEARAKAEQSAKNLDFSLGAVKSVQDSAGFGGNRPYATGANDAVTMIDKASPLTIQPGENELQYSVTVTYFVK